MRRAYKTINFSAERAKLIYQANAIIEEYEKAGYTITLRQLYYQFVARGILPNKKSEYDRLGDAVSDGRIAGLISWTAIEDRTRGLRGLENFKDPAAAMDRVLQTYRLDKWKGQEFRPEVWVEKDALIGVIEPICNELGVDFFGCRGYNSQSEQWRAGRRFASYIQKGQVPIVFHLGDHDPDGVDMTRDNRDRLALFTGVNVQVVRLALNMDQIEQYNPPPNVAKTSSVRYERYVEETGTESSWELDALEPTVIHDLISAAVLRLRDEAKWNDMLNLETEDRERLTELMAQLGDNADGA